MDSKRSNRFVANENGAAAFDWMILAVGIFGLGLAVYSVISAEIGTAPPDQQAASAPAAPVDAATNGPPLLYPYFDETWRRDRIAQYGQMTDADLRAAYAAQYGVATGAVNARIGADLLMVIEAEMTRRGIDLPGGHDSAAEIHRRLSAETSSP